MPSGRRVLVAVLALTGIWCGAALVRVAHLPPGRIDRRWDALMTPASGPVARGAAEALAVVGNGAPATALVIVTGAVIGSTRGWLWGVCLGLTSIVSVLNVARLKALGRRDRPDAAYGTIDGFPSGHTTFAALLGSVVILFDRRIAVRGTSVVWIAAMAWSRTRLRAHWLTDVLAAVVIGAAEAVLFVAVAHRLDRGGSRGRIPAAGAP